MKKEKFHIEYIFDKVSRRSLWNHLTTPPGLSAWFADDVIINGNIYVFKWNKAEQEAEVLSIKPEMSIRYRWMDEQDEKKDSIDLWDTQVEELKRTLGI